MKWFQFSVARWNVKGYWNRHSENSLLWKSVYHLHHLTKSKEICIVLLTSGVDCEPIVADMLYAFVIKKIFLWSVNKSGLPADLENLEKPWFWKVELEGLEIVVFFF